MHKNYWRQHDSAIAYKYPMVNPLQLHFFSLNRSQMLTKDIVRIKTGRRPGKQIEVGSSLVTTIQDEYFEVPPGDPIEVAITLAWQALGQCGKDCVRASNTREKKSRWLIEEMSTNDAQQEVVNVKRKN